MDLSREPEPRPSNRKRISIATFVLGLLFSAAVGGTIVYLPMRLREQLRGNLNREMEPDIETRLDETLQPYLSQYEMPALAAALVKDGKIIAAGAVGTRRARDSLPVSVHDRFHIGSDTKAMTAVIAAIAVESRLLDWNSTIAHVFPELVGKIDRDLCRVTLDQLLTHDSGIATDTDGDENPAFWETLDKSRVLVGDLSQLRYWVLCEFGKRPLAAKPGTVHAYANMNYLIVGAMLERATGLAWEELVTKQLFEPLELKTAGFGSPASLGKIDAPLGHKLIDGKPVAFLDLSHNNVLAVAGPSGNVHMSVLDFARWAGWNAGEGKRGPKIIPTETFKRLHGPDDNGHGMGWGVVHVPWAAEPLRSHIGSDGRYLAHIWIDPNCDFGMVMVTNISTPRADDALYNLAEQLHAKFAKQNTTAR
jgi:CubicO group peptidase (beta-lactamase class C family)